jgi:tetraacyldisaccharide 4'-kinase
MSLQTWLNRIWYERRHPPLWLLPLSWFFAAAAAMRRVAYRVGLRSSAGVGVPVIVVGNLTVGGTGKTPLVCWLAEALTARGFKPGIVTRGYGRASVGRRLVAAADPIEVVGDEPLLLSQRCAVPVAIGRHRASAAELLVAEQCNVVVSDDGLQHLALRRDCEIAVIDGARGFGNGELLPAGPLRELPSRLASVDAVVINGGGGTWGFDHISMRLEGGEAVALRGDERKPLDEWSGTLVHAVAGISHPQRFFNALRAYGIVVDGRALDDHAPIGRPDIEFGDDAPVLLTEKDAVKCRDIADERHWCVPVSAVFEPREAERLLGIVEGKLKVATRG